ncbi:MAG: DNA alkylation repair protein [Cyclobacteriaceae bacterium]
MESITRKPEIEQRVDQFLEIYYSSGQGVAITCFLKSILQKKVRFPLLEYAGTLIFENLKDEDQIPFCDEIQKLKTMGGNVILGIILQKRLPKHFKESLNKTEAYISDADVWYVCDIIGERVWGFSILTDPENTIPEIERLSSHSNIWVVRSLGAGAHYAIKKGLGKKSVERIFKMLLSLANSKNKEIRQGIGWAAKTTAKFHPEIIAFYQSQISDVDNVANWFRRKIKIGLERNRYATGN